MEDQRVDVEPAVRHDLRQVAERVGQRRRVRVAWTKTNGPHVSTPRRAARARHGPGPRPRAARRAARRRDHRSTRGSGTAASCSARRPTTTSAPRWRQTLTNARSVPSRSRTTTIGTSPARQVKYEPGSAISPAWPAYCHAPREQPLALAAPAPRDRCTSDRGVSRSCRDGRVGDCVAGDDRLARPGHGREREVLAAAAVLDAQPRGLARTRPAGSADGSGTRPGCASGRAPRR